MHEAHVNAIRKTFLFLFSIALLVDLDPSEQEPSESEHEPSEQEQSEQSEYSSEPTATFPPAEPSKLHAESLAGTNSSSESDEQLLMDFYEQASALIDSSSKRKDSAEMEIACSAAKRCKPSQEMDNGAAVHPTEGK